jgi:hypothetical protein
MITKNQLKQEIEQLDYQYRQLVFRLLQQFTHQVQLTQKLDEVQRHL